MSIEPDEIIKRQNDRIARLESALKTVHAIVKWKAPVSVDSESIKKICAKALEEKP